MPTSPPKTKNPASPQPEYDFSHGVRGKYAAHYARGTNLVRLEPDVARAFPDARSVNQALRALAAIVRRQAASAGPSRVEK